MRLVIVFIIFLCLASCTAERRMNRLIKKHPELLTHDTVTVRDSVFIKGTSVDTVFTTDSLVIVKDNMRIFYYENAKGEKRIRGECRDTVHHFTRDTVIRTVHSEAPARWEWLIVAAACGFSLASIFWAMIRK